jgi:hypothetical protein
VKVTSKCSSVSVKVFVNGILHLHFRRDKFLGLQAWQYESEQMFYVEVLLAGGSLLCDYDRRDLWVSVLKELEKVR